MKEREAFQRLLRDAYKSAEGTTQIHFGFGSSHLMGRSSAIGLAAANLLNRLRCIISSREHAPLATSCDGALMLLSNEDEPDSAQAYQLSPQTEHTLAGLFGIAGTLLQINCPQIKSNILYGSFNAEVGLLADAAVGRHSLTFTASDQLNGQAVLYAIDEHTLLGEEVYDEHYHFTELDSRKNISSIRDKLQESLGWVLILGLLIGFAARWVGVL